MIGEEKIFGICCALLISASALMLASPASAQGQKYIFDIVKQNPRILHAWERIVPSEYSSQKWIEQLFGTTTPVKRIVVRGKPFYLGDVCIQHDCGGNFVVFLIAVDASEIYGMLSSQSLNVEHQFFGKPDQEGRWLMTKHMANLFTSGGETEYRTHLLALLRTLSFPTPIQRKGNEVSVPMRIVGGTYVVPVLINAAITLDFIVDSGATDVSIPADVVLTLMRTGTLKRNDFLGQQTYVLADGSKVPSETFRIRSLKVGNEVLENVTGSISSVNSTLLLGQSFLRRFKSWSIDNTRHALVLRP